MATKREKVEKREFPPEERIKGLPICSSRGLEIWIITDSYGNMYGLALGVECERSRTNIRRAQLNRKNMQAQDPKKPTKKSEL